MSVYLDNAATTKPSLEVVDAITKGLTELYGNPSSLHKVGLNAQLVMDDARATISKAIGCDMQELYFTSGATESNNIALRGAMGANGRRKKHIVVSSVEHSSVKETVDALELQGFEVTRVSPNENGIFNVLDFVNAINENTCLISMMLVNNETGYIMPVKEVFKAVKRKFPEVLTHCDCVQGFMKIQFKTKELNADLISLSAHKIYGAKGVGALYIKKGVRLLPIITGGKQEKSIRSGTESVPLIMGFGTAVKNLVENIANNYSKALELKEYFFSLIDNIEDIKSNEVDNANYSAYIINISVKGIRSEIMLHFLEELEIYVSSGSACSKGAKSGVLEEFGISRENADSTLRISTSIYTTKQDINSLVEGIKSGLASIMRVR